MKKGNISNFLLPFIEFIKSLEEQQNNGSWIANCSCGLNSILKEMDMLEEVFNSKKVEMSSIIILQ